MCHPQKSGGVVAVMSVVTLEWWYRCKLWHWCQLLYWCQGWYWCQVVVLVSSGCFGVIWWSSAVGVVVSLVVASVRYHYFQNRKINMPTKIAKTKQKQRSCVHFWHGIDHSCVHFWHGIDHDLDAFILAVGHALLSLPGAHQSVFQGHVCGNTESSLSKWYVCMYVCMYSVCMYAGRQAGRQAGKSES